MRSSSSSYANARRNAGASRFRAEHRLGGPRPSLQSLRTTNNTAHQAPSEAETDYDSYYEDEDELEAEALLSRKHGEAAEAGSTDKNSSKRGAAAATDQDIRDEYAQQEKERKKKARRKVQLTISADDLIKPKGLTVVRHGIAPRFQNHPKYTHSTPSMAKFSRRLMAAYADWMEDLNGLNVYEHHWKLRTMAGKSQIKPYLQDLRKSVRNDHVERVLGLEKAQRLLGQLEDYYHQEDDDQYDQDPPPQYSGDEEEGPTDREAESPSAIANPYASNSNSNTNSNSDAPTSAAAGRSVAITPTTTTKTAKEPQQQQPPPQEEEDPLHRRLRLQKEQRARRRVLDDSDDDDEDEALFDDVVDGSATATATATTTTKEETTSTPSPQQQGASRKSSHTKAARRHVLEDSDDDDESDNDDDGDKNDKNVDGTVGEKNDDDAGHMEDAPKTNSRPDDKTAGDSEAETTTATSSPSRIHKKLEEQFESVKALLEGKDTDTTAPTSEEPRPTNETPLPDGETDAVMTDQDDPNQEDVSVSEPVSSKDGDEKVQQEESTTAMEDPTEGDASSSKDNEKVTASGLTDDEDEL